MKINRPQLVLEMGLGTSGKMPFSRWSTTATRPCLTLDIRQFWKYCSIIVRLAKLFHTCVLIFTLRAAWYVFELPNISK